MEINLKIRRKMPKDKDEWKISIHKDSKYKDWLDGMEKFKSIKIQSIKREMCGFCGGEIVTCKEKPS